MSARWLVNGRSVERVAAADRGFQYGDGVFETMALRDGAPRFWALHHDRLTRGCERLGIEPVPAATLVREITRLTAGASDAVVKLIVTRGAGGRGYAPGRAGAPTRVLSMHPHRDWPAAHYTRGIRLRICATRLGCNPALAGIKHLNRLEQVLGRREAADADAEEGLMLDEAGRVIAGTMTNLFLVEGGALVTPALDRCGVEGIMRGLVLECASQAGIRASIEDVGEGRVAAADGLFVTNALIGLWPISACAGRELAPDPLTRALMRALAARGVRECAV